MSKLLFRARENTGTESGLRPSPHPMAPALWRDGSNVVFFEGGPQKMAGWVAPVGATPGTLSSEIRGMNALKGSDAIQRLFFGNASKLWMWTPGTLTELGTGYTGHANEASTYKASTWSLVPWGNFMIASNGVDPVVYWPGTGTTANTLSGPTFTRAECLARLGPHILAFNTDVDQAGFHWCADDAITQWDPGTYETAGDFVIRDFDGEITAVCPFADRLVVAGQSRLYTVSFIGAPYFFSTLPMLFGSGACSKAALLEANRMLFGFDSQGPWMSDGQTAVRIASPAIREYILGTIDTSQLSKVCMTHVRRTQEVWFFFPVAGGGGAGVSYKYDNQSWTKLGFWRTACVPQVSAFTQPYAASATQVLAHENGVDDGTSAMSAYAQTKPLDMEDPDTWKLIDRVAVQVRRMTGTLSVQVGVQDELDAAISWSASQTLDDGFESMYFRQCGRWISLKFSSNALSADFALSGFDVYGEPAGSVA